MGRIHAKGNICQDCVFFSVREKREKPVISKEYEEMNEKAEVIPKSDPSSSDQVNFIAAATQRYVNSVDPGELPEGGAVPVIEIDENENAKNKTLARYFSGFCFMIVSYVLNCPSIPSQI